MEVPAIKVYLAWVFLSDVQASTTSLSFKNILAPEFDPTLPTPIMPVTVVSGVSLPLYCVSPE